MTEELSKSTNSEIRQEIAKIVGIDKERYKDRRKNFTKGHIREIGEYIDPESTDTEMNTLTLFKVVCRLCDSEYEDHKNRKHGLSRENLKKVYKQIRIVAESGKTLKRHEEMRKDRIKRLQQKPES